MCFDRPSKHALIVSQTNHYHLITSTPRSARAVRCSSSSRYSRYSRYVLYKTTASSPYKRAGRTDDTPAPGRSVPNFDNHGYPVNALPSAVVVVTVVPNTPRRAAARLHAKLSARLYARLVSQVARIRGDGWTLTWRGSGGRGGSVPRLAHGRAALEPLARPLAY